ncbi:MAG: tripartite tricarboxylate transporter substrate binding protein [Clostridiales bacterium]|jgi:tripartite-type tricarboxylate transporter receptor subunit TctC|nr:tripartite tricarboxylate transporter substrate binding protein [Clostridiales bacterium]
MKMQKPQKLICIAVAAAIMAGCASSGNNSSSGWPKRSIEIAVGFAAGGDTDLFARAMAEGIGKELGVSVIVTNMIGGGGSVAANYVKDATNDGYVVNFCHNPLVGNYVCGISDYWHNAFETSCIVAKNDSIYLTLNPTKYPTLDDYLNYAKSNPGATTFGAVYGGSFQPLTMGVIADLGLDVKLVDSGGAAEGNVEVTAGRIDAVISTLAGSKAYLDSGDLYPALVLSEARKPEYPDVPTLKEIGGENSTAMYYGFYFPKGTDQQIIDAFNKAAETVSKSQSFADLTKTYGVDPFFQGYGDAEKTMDSVLEFYLPYKDIISGVKS